MLEQPDGPQLTREEPHGNATVLSCPGRQQHRLHPVFLRSLSGPPTLPDARLPRHEIQEEIQEELVLAAAGLRSSLLLPGPALQPPACAHPAPGTPPPLHSSVSGRARGASAAYRAEPGRRGASLPLPRLTPAFPAPPR